MKKGCLIILGVLGAGVLAFLGLFIWIWLSGDVNVDYEYESRVPAPDFESCSPAQEAHLTAVNAAVRSDADQLDEFRPEQGTANSRREVRKRIRRLFDFDITCVNDVTPAECPYGAQDVGWVVLGEAQFRMCNYTQPTTPFCDSYAGMVYSHARTRGMWERDAERYFHQAKSICLSNHSARQDG